MSNTSVTPRSQDLGQSEAPEEAHGLVSGRTSKLMNLD